MLLTLMGNLGMFSNGKSGYWRLFFYKLQEESLKKGKEGLLLESQPPTATDPVKDVARAKKRVVRKVKKVPDEKVIAEVASDYPINYVVRFPAPTRKMQVSMAERIAKIPDLDIVSFSRLAYNHQVTVVNLEAERKKRRRREEDVLLLLAA